MRSVRSLFHCCGWGCVCLLPDFGASCPPACVVVVTVFVRGLPARVCPSVRPSQEELCVRSVRSLFRCCEWGCVCVLPDFGASCPPACVVGVTVFVRGLPARVCPCVRPSRGEACVRSVRSLLHCCGWGCVCLLPDFGAPCAPACGVGATLFVRALPARPLSHIS